MNFDLIFFIRLECFKFTVPILYFVDVFSIFHCNVVCFCWLEMVIKLLNDSSAFSPVSECGFYFLMCPQDHWTLRPEYQVQFRYSLSIRTVVNSLLKRTELWSLKCLEVLRFLNLLPWLHLNRKVGLGYSLLVDVMIFCVKCYHQRIPVIWPLVGCIRDFPSLFEGYWNDGV
jgi:hypothetical protein